MAISLNTILSYKDKSVSIHRDGPTMLDVNAGVPGADESVIIAQLMQEVMSVVDVPLCIDTANPQALEAALKLYEGKA